MKALLLAFILFPLIAIADSLPPGVSLAIDVNGSTNNLLAISPKESVVIALKFLNTTNQSVRIRIHEFDPYHQKLPYPVDCYVRITDTNNQVPGFAEANGEWWSQFICWSSMFDKDDERNYRTLKPGEELLYNVSLGAVLTVPVGGESEGWPYNPKSGFRIGDYRFTFRYGDSISKMFSLKVDGNNAKTRQSTVQ